MKYLFGLLVVFLFLFSGCSNFYDYEENNLNEDDFGVDDEVNVKVKTSDSNDVLDDLWISKKDETSGDIELNDNIFPENIGEYSIDSKNFDLDDNLKIEYKSINNNEQVEVELIKNSYNSEILNNDYRKYDIFYFNSNNEMFIAIETVGGFSLLKFEGLTEDNIELFVNHFRNKFNIDFDYLKSLNVDKIINSLNDIYTVDVYVGIEYGSEIESGNGINIADDFELELEAEYDEENNKVRLEWNNDYSEDDFKYYKVMYSKINSDLKYPHDFVIGVYDYVKADDFYHYHPSVGTNYYRITMVLNNGNYIHSNVKKVVIGDTEIVEIENDSKEEFKDSLDLNLYYTDGEGVKIHWDSNGLDDSNFKYYEIVHSITNSNLKYPEDGQITEITDFNTEEYIDESNFVKGENNFYRVTYVYEDKKVHGIVQDIFIEDEGEEDDSAFERVSCVDSDEGENDYYNLGIVTGMNRCIYDGVTMDCIGGAVEKTDMCIQSSFNIDEYGIKPAVLEGYCGDDDRITTQRYLCPFGCSNGVCLEEEPNSEFIENKYPEYNSVNTGFANDYISKGSAEINGETYTFMTFRKNDETIPGGCDGGILFFAGEGILNNETYNMEGFVVGACYVSVVANVYKSDSIFDDSTLVGQSEIYYAEDGDTKLFEIELSS